MRLGSGFVEGHAPDAAQGNTPTFYPIPEPVHFAAIAARPEKAKRPPEGGRFAVSAVRSA
jgi:hypothetical protein